MSSPLRSRKEEAVPCPDLHKGDREKEVMAALIELTSPGKLNDHLVVCT